MTRSLRRIQTLTPITLLIALSIILAGCGGSDDGRALTVFAASSLTEALGEAGEAFEAENGGVTVRFHFAGSARLRAQIEQGAQADVFAPADTRQMARVVDAGLVSGTVESFASNTLVVVTAKNGAQIERLHDLARPGLRLVIALPEVPAGAYARNALAALDGLPGYGPGFAASVLGNVVSEETNVRSVLAKVSLGEADAGFVYRTDTRGTPLRTLALPPAADVATRYEIAALTTARDPALAAAFVRFMTSDAGREIMRGHGFGAPPGVEGTP